MMNKLGFMKNMKGFKIGAVVLAAVFAVSMFMASCYLPNPLYGTWTDNDGNKIQFVDDGSFSARIKETDGTIDNYEGSWATVDNVLIFNIKGDTSYTRNTEWDIRGAMLYLTWTANGKTTMLNLYHTAR